MNTDTVNRMTEVLSNTDPAIDRGRAGASAVSEASRLIATMSAAELRHVLRNINMLCDRDPYTTKYAESIVSRLPMVWTTKGRPILRSTDVFWLLDQCLIGGRRDVEILSGHLILKDNEMSDAVVSMITYDWYAEHRNSSNASREWAYSVAKSHLTRKQLQDCESYLQIVLWAPHRKYVSHTNNTAGSVHERLVPMLADGPVRVQHVRKTKLPLLVEALSSNSWSYLVAVADLILKDSGGEHSSLADELLFCFMSDAHMHTRDLFGYAPGRL